MVMRVKFFFDPDFIKQCDADLNAMNKGKRGSPYLFPKSFILSFAFIQVGGYPIVSLIA
jgi:hypothetical protein